MQALHLSRAAVRNAQPLVHLKHLHLEVNNRWLPAPDGLQQMTSLETIAFTDSRSVGGILVPGLEDILDLGDLDLKDPDCFT